MKKLVLPLLFLLAVGMLLAVESAPSDVVGYVKYDLVAGNNLAAIPMSSPWAWASELGIELGEGIVDQISYWDATSQSFLGAADLGGFWDGDFEIMSGSVVLVYSYSPKTMYSIGNLPAANAMYSLVPGNNTVMIPLNRSDLAWASEVGIEMGEGIVDQVSYWDSASQSFLGAADLGGFWDGDFEVAIGNPLLVYSYDTISWPARSRSAQTRNTKSK